MLLAVNGQARGAEKNRRDWPTVAVRRLTVL